MLRPSAPTLDRPTLMALGVQMLIAGDDNRNATVTMRYRQAGTTTWRNAQPLYRVKPENNVNWTVAPQFAGSILDLRPGTTYEIELRAVDPDGNVNQTYNLTGTTRTVPRDPVNPRVRPVSDANGLRAAVNSAQPGDIISLADGVYQGPFTFFAQGTPTNPVVIRGASQNGTILDGGCEDCNVVQLYGTGYVYFERMTLRNGYGGIRFQQPGAQGNVMRRVRIVNTIKAINTQPDQLDFYLTDNILEGNLIWPSTYDDDGGVHANDLGIRVQGHGHVMAHNRIWGFGDALRTEQNGARSIDVYGNDVLYSYDNGVELDDSEGNIRCSRNRFANTYATISVQPIRGGPAYIYRNVSVNSVNEQLKFHPIAGPYGYEEPNGVFVYHNTFVSPNRGLNLQSSATSHHFVIANNLFVGPQNPLAGRTFDWSGFIDDGVFDYNGYFPAGQFALNYSNLGYRLYPNFGAIQALGMEPHGTTLSGNLFANGLTAPPTFAVTMAPPDLTLASNSGAIDRGTPVANINDGFNGAAPDLGALEIGCPMPIYGPRPEGVDETNEPLGCTGGPTAPTPDFDLSAAGSTVSVTAGNSTSTGLSIAARNGFSGAVGFSVAGLPAGVTASFGPATLSGAGSTTLTLASSGSTVAGSYGLTVTATSGTLTHSVPLSLTVAAAPVSPPVTPPTTPTSGNSYVTWTNLFNVTATGNGSVQQTGGCNGCPAGALSQQTLTSGEGYLEFTIPDANMNRVVGLLNGPLTYQFRGLSWALWIWGGVEVRESGQYRAETSYKPGDVFRIAVSGGRMVYSKNGTVFYTSSVAPSYPLQAGFIPLQIGASVSNAVISGQ